MRSNLLTGICISFLLFSLLGCAGEKHAYRVAVIRYQHETCTFCPGGDTEIEDWTRISPVLRGEEVLEADDYVRGFTAWSRESGDIELIGIASPYEVFGGSSRSWNSEESFEYFMGRILDDLRSRMPVDAVYLALHGAMAVRNIPRPEAEIARRVRELVGDEIPIVATFDLHGNEDDEFLKWADGAFVTKRYPHYDAYIQGERAARFTRLVMKGEYIPTTSTRKPPVITATVLQWTGHSPSMDIMERARRWESREDDAYVNVFFGYPWSDVPDVGTTVQVITNNDQAKADRIAGDMEDYIWRVREDFAFGDHPMPGEAVAQTRQALSEGNTPVVLGDYSDRPGDATWILKELIEQQVSNVLYACIRDEGVLQALTETRASSGDPFQMAVGGFTGPQAGEPVKISGTIRYFGPAWSYERIAVIDYAGDNTLIIVPAYTQITEPGRLNIGGIKHEEYDVFVLKSRVHFRRGFDETGYARTIIVVDAPGPWVGTTRLDALDYRFAPIETLYPIGAPEKTEDR